MEKKGTCTFKFHVTENPTSGKDTAISVRFLWKKKPTKSICNTFIKMFLNKCLLFKEIQLHLKHFSTCKESVHAAGRDISPSEHLQGFLIKKSSYGLFSSPLSITTVDDETMSQVSGKNVIMLYVS